MIVAAEAGSIHISSASESDGGFGSAEFFSAEIRPFRPKFEFETGETGDAGLKNGRTPVR